VKNLKIQLLTEKSIHIMNHQIKRLSWEEQRYYAELSDDDYGKVPTPRYLCFKLKLGLNKQ
jgi:hypothetical protein